MMNGNNSSVLASLRSMVPLRGLRFSEALRVAELQALRLLELTGVETEAVPSEVVTELPRIRVEARELPTSGITYWDGQSWVIGLNRTEPVTRQRFTLLHEFKHILDHGRTSKLYRTELEAEQAADYFAGCALVPRPWLKRAWASGIQQPTLLARVFDVSAPAIAVRLAQTGLTEPNGRHEPRSPRRTYRREVIEKPSKERAA